MCKTVRSRIHLNSEFLADIPTCIHLMDCQSRQEKICNSVQSVTCEQHVHCVCVDGLRLKKNLQE